MSNEIGPWSTNDGGIYSGMFVVGVGSMFYFN